MPEVIKLAGGRTLTPHAWGDQGSLPGWLYRDPARPTCEVQIRHANTKAFHVRPLPKGQGAPRGSWVRGDLLIEVVAVCEVYLEDPYRRDV